MRAGAGRREVGRRGAPGVTAVPRSPQEPELDSGLRVAVRHLADPGQEAAPRGECRPPRRPAAHPGPGPALTPLCAPQIIEKRRRDRINNSLSELRRLVPSAFEKQVGRRLSGALPAAPGLCPQLPPLSPQGSAKLEKAEILQMTMDHLKMLHTAGGKGKVRSCGGAVALMGAGVRAGGCAA